MGGEHNSQNAKALICVILGQTASGKSSLCLDLAKRLDGEILSMDALKVYRGMDIGTAKPSQADQEAVPHHLIDIVNPDQKFNAALYLEQLEKAIHDVLSRGRMPIIDCGTPLYLKVFLSGMIEAPDPDPELRAELDAMAVETLHRRLGTVDPEAAETLHPNDRLRVTRALEYALQTGRPISQEQTQFTTRRDDYRIALTGPLRQESDLKARISQRVDRMLEGGLVDEVKRISEGAGFSETSGKAIGYRQILQHLAGEMPLNAAIEKIKSRTWQLARKQMMWFKRYPDVKWLQIKDDEEARRAGIFLATELIGELRGHSPVMMPKAWKQPRLNDLEQS